MKRISVIINTLNEEKNLPRAIASVKDLAYEIIVVDMHSEDQTVEEAKKLGAKVYAHERVGYVEPARNFGISKANGEWVLVLDADEEIGSDLGKFIKKLVEKPGADYIRLPRKNMVFGKWLRYSRWWPDYNIRLFKKGHVSWNETIHSVPMTVGTGRDLPDKEEKAIVHHHYDSVEQYIARMNSYTTIHAQIRIKEGYKFRWQDLVKKPVSEFLSRYFFGQGYKDGLHGLALSLLQAFSELTLYLKIWQATRFKPEAIAAKEVVGLMRHQEKEFHYWQNDTLFKETGNLSARIKRKLRI